MHVDLPAEGAISLAGFGPAKFGASAEEVRMAWGGDLGDAKPSEPGGCYYLIPATQPKRGYKIAFMIEGDKFVRLDVASDEIVAPGGGKIGMDEAGLQKLYRGALQSMPHKYVEGGHYLSVAASGVAPSKLVFETDANGKATEWRIGLTPQVDYVEGCS
ncbi:MAG TPA: lectin [Pseudoxanthomonas sp.]|nr:lectin [Pseudoxanthomonas sp.]